MSEQVASVGVADRVQPPTVDPVGSEAVVHGNRLPWIEPDDL
jgi:hypothetical protein